MEQGRALEDRPMPELMKKLSDQTTTLVRQEIELAKAEMTAKGKQVGIGAGAFGGAALVGLYAFGALHRAPHPRAQHGRRRLARRAHRRRRLRRRGRRARARRQERRRPARRRSPERAISSTKEDVEWAKTRAKSARQ